jgi:hypothetical protein
MLESEDRKSVNKSRNDESKVREGDGREMKNEKKKNLGDSEGDSRDRVGGESERDLRVEKEEKENHICLCF